MNKLSRHFRKANSNIYSKITFERIKSVEFHNVGINIKSSVTNELLLHFDGICPQICKS